MPCIYQYFVSISLVSVVWRLMRVWFPLIANSLFLLIYFPSLWFSFSSSYVFASLLLWCLYSLDFLQLFHQLGFLVGSHACKNGGVQQNLQWQHVADSWQRIKNIFIQPSSSKEDAAWNTFWLSECYCWDNIAYITFGKYSGKWSQRAAKDLPLIAKW